MSGEFNKFEYDRTRGVRNDKAIRPNPFAYTAMNSASKGDEYSAFRENNGVETRAKPSVAVKAKESEAVRAKVVSAVAAIVGAVVVGVVSVEDIIAPLPKIEHTLETYADAVRYTVSYNAKEYTPKNDIKVIVKNDFTNREQVFAIEKDVEKDEEQTDRAQTEENADGGTQEKDAADNAVDYTVTYEGYFENLQTNMTYTFKVVDGTRTLVSDTFKTKGVQMMLTDDQLKFDSFYVSDTSISGSIRIVDYTPSGDLSVGVSGENENYLRKVFLENTEQRDYKEQGNITQPRFAEEDPTGVGDGDGSGDGGGQVSDEPDWEQFFHGFVEPDGSITIEFWFDDLTPGKAYKLNVYDGDRVIYTLDFGTKEKDYTISDDQISFDEFGFYNGSLSAYVTISDYTRLGDMSVRLTGNGETQVKNVYFEQRESDQPYEEADVDWDNVISGWTSEGETYLSIWFEGVVTTVEYRLEIIDDGHVIYTKTFTMPADPEVTETYVDSQETALYVGLRMYSFAPSKDASVILSGGYEYYSKTIYFSEDSVPEGEANYIWAWPDNVNGGYTVSCQFTGLTPSTTYTLFLYYGSSTVFNNSYTTLVRQTISSNDISFEGFEPTATEASATVFINNYTVRGDMYMTVRPADGSGTTQTKSFYFLDGSDVPGDLDQQSVIFAQYTGDDNETLYFTFHFDSLTPDTLYELSIYDNGESVYTMTFTTEKGTAFDVKLLEVTENGATIYVSIYDYEIVSTLYVGVVPTYGTDGGKQKQVVIASEPLTETEDYVYATVSDDGTISFTVNFTGLTQVTQYTFNLTDGGETLYTTTFDTEAKVYTVTEDQVTKEISAGRNYVVGYMEVTGYEPEAGLSVSVESEYNDLQTKNVYFDETEVPEGETDYVFGSVNDETGEISFEFGFESLVAGIEYTLTLYDNGYYMYSTTFNTVSAQITDGMISFENVEITDDTLLGSVTISDYSDHGYMEIWLTDKNETVVARSNLAFLDDQGLIIDPNEQTEGCIYANVIDGAVVFGFNFEGLTELTEYTFTVYNENEEVYSTTFTTTERSTMLGEDQVSFSVGDETEHGFAVSMEITDYEVQNALYVNLYVGDDMKLTQTIVAVEEIGEIMEGEDLAQYVVDESDGTITIVLSFNSLTQNTTYTLEFHDGGDVIYTATATTSAKDYLVDPSYVTDNTEVNKFSVYVSLEIAGYDVDGSITLSIRNGDYNTTKNVYFDGSQVPEGATDYIMDINYYSSGVITIGYAFEGLSPDTGYEIILAEDGNMMYSMVVQTLDDKVDDNISLNVYPGKTSVTYSFEITNFKQEAALSVVVRVPNGETMFTDTFPMGYSNDSPDAFVVGNQSQTGLTASTTYEFVIFEGDYEIYSTTFTTHDYALNDSQVSVTKEYYEYQETGAGEFYITDLQITGYNPTTNIYLSVYDKSGTLVQYSDKIVYYAGDSGPAASVDGSVTKDNGGSVESLVFRDIELGNLTPGEVYYFRIYDGNTLLYEAVWIAAAA